MRVLLALGVAMAAAPTPRADATVERTSSLRVVAVRPDGRADAGPVFARAGEPVPLAVVLDDGERCWASAPVHLVQSEPVRSKTPPARPRRPGARTSADEGASHAAVERSQQQAHAEQRAGVPRGAAPAQRGLAPHGAVLTTPHGGMPPAEARAQRDEGRACEPLAADALASLRLFVARPAARDLDNLAACPPATLRRGCHVPLTWTRGEPAPDELARPGTHRVGASLTLHGRTLTTAGASGPTLDEARAHALLELVVRRGDDYVGLATELLGVPFVHAPATLSDGTHQTDARLGADCVALVLYGRRRLGRHVPYGAPATLARYTTPVGTGPVRRGDVLHFGFQTALLAEDRPPLGTLDAGDLVLHTFHGVAEEVTFGQLPYRRMQVRVLRWRD